MFELYADKNQLTLRQREMMTSGSVNVYPVRFEFSVDWEGLSKTAVFQGGGKSVSVRLDESGETTIPWEVLQRSSSYLSVGVYGTQGEEIVLPTRWERLGVVFPGAAPGEEARPPTPELWQQELARKGDGLDYDGLNLSLLSGGKPISTVKITGGGGSTVPGPKGDKGDPGPQGPAGSDGKDATINGQNTLEIVAGENVSLRQEGGTLTISANAGGVTMEQVQEAIAAAIGDAIKEAY